MPKPSCHLVEAQIPKIKSNVVRQCTARSHSANHAAAATPAKSTPAKRTTFSFPEFEDCTAGDDGSAVTIGGGVASGVACVLVNSGVDEVDEGATVDVRTVVDVFVLDLLLLVLFMGFELEWRDGLEVLVGCAMVLLWPVGYDGL